MRVIINGEKEDLGVGYVSIVDLLKLKNVESPEMVSVQLNGSIVERDEYLKTHVSEDDEVDFLYFMGGGSR